jgi:multicomponent K+:H+ antiporter subunit C
MMLVVATRLLLPLAMVVGLYIFLRGHNLPGGGFIAGLVISIAILMQYMASGFEWARERRPIEHHTLISLGVLVAAATGTASLLFEAPLFTSSFGYFHLPLIGELELATGMSLEFLVASTIAVLTAAGIYLCLRARTFPVVLGLAMLSYAINVFLFSIGRLVVDRPPIYAKGLDQYADPLPQALVLTAIVISFGMSALVVVLALRTYLETGTDQVDGEPEPGEEEA